MKKHFFLIAGEITFVTPNQETGQVRLNAIVQNDANLFPVSSMGKAQQALQLHFYKKLGDADAGQAAKTQVIDVVLLNVSYLGEMTEEEFHAAPAGMKLQERAPGDDAGTQTVN